MKLFPSRIRDISFWYYHTIGWFIYASVQLSLLLTLRGWWLQSFIDISIQLIVVYFLFLGLRLYYRRIPAQTLGLVHLISRIIIASFLLSVVWLLVWIGIELIPADSMIFRYSKVPLMLADRLAMSFPIFLAWSALYFGIKAWRDWLNERDQAEQAIEAAQRSQLQMLRYQLNPHFLFNALNSVRALIDEDSRSAKTMITELSEFLRFSLVSRNKPVVSLKEELDAIRLYLSIEQQRYEDKLDVRFDIDKRTEEIPVPSFLIHPLVEDALRSGMQTSAIPLSVEIISTIADGMLKIDIIHSGTSIGIQGDGTHEPGWEQISARLKESFPGRYRLTASRQNSRTHTTLELEMTNGLNHEEKTANHSHR